MARRPVRPCPRDRGPDAVPQDAVCGHVTTPLGPALVKAAMKGSPHAPGAWDADALVDRERLLQVAGSLARFAVLEVAAADSFQRGCFRHRQSDASGNGERLGVVVPGLAGGRCAGGQLAEAVERIGFADAVTQFPVQRKGLGVAGEGGCIVASQLLHPAKVVQSKPLDLPVTEFAHDGQCPLQAGGCGRVVHHFALQAA